MTETREQYRERLAWTAYRAFMDHIKIDGTKEYDELLPETKDAMHAEAEAVAAQVLRDLMESFPKNEPLYHGWGDEVDIRDRIVIFADERGISLEDES